MSDFENSDKKVVPISSDVERKMRRNSLVYRAKMVGTGVLAVVTFATTSYLLKSNRQSQKHEVSKSSVEAQANSNAIGLQWNALVGVANTLDLLDKAQIGCPTLSVQEKKSLLDGNPFLDGTAETVLDRVADMADRALEADSDGEQLEICGPITASGSVKNQYAYYNGTVAQGVYSSRINEIDPDSYDYQQNIYQPNIFRPESTDGIDVGVPLAYTLTGVMIALDAIKRSRQNSLPVK